MARPDDTLLTAGEVARAFGVSTKQVANWDRAGLLTSAFRTMGGQRRFRAEDVERARSILPKRPQRDDVRTEEIILLRDTGKLTWQAIAAKLGMSAEGTRRRYNKAKRSA